LAAQRLLLEGDKPVRLGSRAFDILIALVERPGEVVGKDQLIARAWPQTFVEESNLKIQMSALRRALGDGQGGNRYVITVPGRGYNFVAPVRREEAMVAVPAPPVPSATPHNLPFAATRMIGRDDAVAALITRLSRERLVTIVGTGGIGKTTVALAVAERLIASYEDGVWLVDLAPLADPRLVPSVVATTLGLEIRTVNALPDLIAWLRDRRTLLVFDNCEHVIDAVASLTAAILSGVTGASILATSREPLGMAGESEYRLTSLAVPTASSKLTAAEAAAFPAVQLFVDRVTAIVEDFALTDKNAPAVAEICHRLDGLPLAIEFAAPRVEVLGVEGLAARLDDSLQLLGARRRTTLPRHRTMRGVLDWSYGLLGQDEQRFFRTLGVFAGGFTVEAAAAVVPDAAKSRNNAIDHLADLAAKSLVVADCSGIQPRFRLLDTTRAYTIEKLDSSGARELVARRHAEYYFTLFKRAETEAPARPSADWLADYAREIDNLRGALDWAFSRAGDESLGVALTAAAVPLWRRLLLLEECGRRARQALDALEAAEALGSHEKRRFHIALGALNRGPNQEILLLTTLGNARVFTTGPSQEAIEVFQRALTLAEGTRDVDDLLRALRGMISALLAVSKLNEADELVHRFVEVAAAKKDDMNFSIADRWAGLISLAAGRLAHARACFEKILAHPVTVPAKPSVAEEHDGLRLGARVGLCQVLWLEGFPDQAGSLAKESMREAVALNNSLHLSYALVQVGCQMSFFLGDLSSAEDHIRKLLNHCSNHGSGIWLSWARCFEAELMIKQGHLANGISALRKGIDSLVSTHWRVEYARFSSELARALGLAGQTAEALTVIEHAIDHCHRTGERWSLPEVLRIKGGLMSDSHRAEDLFREGIDLAQKQHALSWRLRLATSLAGLLHRQSRNREALKELGSAYGSFSEGFSTVDLVRARKLLSTLESA
jgi:predicted ATPase/DNA-binding winged helix-turn-helix (wHTH) protein